jgi:hypothetical protein
LAKKVILKGNNTMEATITKTKKVTWEDFTLEEHMRAHVNDETPIPPNCRFIIKTVGENVYRYNVVDIVNNDIINSNLLRVIISPDGYIFQTI